MNAWARQNPIVRVDSHEYDRDTVTEIVVPEGVTQIDDETFACCRNLVSISLPNSLTRIRREAIEFCISLVSITIPPSVNWIDGYAFAHCSSLTTVNVHPSTEIHPTAFHDCTTLNNVATSHNLSYVEYVRLQNRIKHQDRINLRVAVHMCTNSKIRFDFNVTRDIDNKLRGVLSKFGSLFKSSPKPERQIELDGVLALSLLNDDIWRCIVEFL